MQAIIKHQYGHFYEVTSGGETVMAALPIERNKLIGDIMRKRYSVNDEIALLANGSDTDKHAKELEEYQTFRASVKSGIASIQAEIDALNEAFAKENAEHEKAMSNNLNTEE